MNTARTDDPDEPFNGDPLCAINRIHELTEIACEHLAPHTLNLASFNLTVYLAVTLGTDELQKKLTRELEAECKILRRRRRLAVVSSNHAKQPDAAWQLTTPSRLFAVSLPIQEER